MTSIARKGVGCDSRMAGRTHCSHQGLETWTWGLHTARLFFSAHLWTISSWLPLLLLQMVGNMSPVPACPYPHNYWEEHQLTSLNQVPAPRRIATEGMEAGRCDWPGPGHVLAQPGGMQGTAPDRVLRVTWLEGAAATPQRECGGGAGDTTVSSFMPYFPQILIDATYSVSVTDPGNER